MCILLGALKHLDKILFAVIEIQVRDVDDVMEACFVDSLSLMSVCENVCVLVWMSWLVLLMNSLLYY